MRTKQWLALVLSPALALVACGSDRSGFNQDPQAGGDPGAGGGGAAFGTDAGASDAKPMPIGTVTGKVVAPEGTIPIADALVYLTRTQPPPIPSGVYCDKCVELTSYAFTYSNPDGTFELPAYAEGDQFIVTQKGQFRRVRPVTIARGTQSFPQVVTRLPAKNNEAIGDTIPRMKVMQANWDSITTSLKKLGIEEFTGPPGGFTQDNTLESIAEASKYHIIFVPCAGSVNSEGSGQVCSGIYAPSSASKAATKEFIQRGGKLYVTDWSYEYVRQIWPGFIHFAGENAQIGSACTIGDYSGPAEFDDPQLKQWMIAIGEGNAELKKNYIGITSTAPQPGLDEDGNPVTITPKVWASTVTGGVPRTATVSFQDKCGRVMYSTYHAEGTDNGGSNTLLAQEKALFHILLEVSACVGVKPPPVK